MCAGTLQPTSLYVLLQHNSCFFLVPTHRKLECETKLVKLMHWRHRTGVNAASVAEAALMMVLMLARRVPEQLQTFAERGLGSPLGMQLAGKTLGIIGMGAIGAHY